LRGTGQSRTVFEGQHLAGSFYFFCRFSLYLAQPLSFPLSGKKTGGDD